MFKKRAPKHMGHTQLALSCLAHLALNRPRSPCLHQQQQQRRSAPPGRRRRPGCCCEVQARRARPIRGEVSQARQGKVGQPALACSGPGPGPGFCPGSCPASPQALGPLFGPWPFIRGFHWPIIYMVPPRFPCGVGTNGAAIWSCTLAPLAAINILVPIVL